MHFFAWDIQVVVEHFLVECHLQGVALLGALLSAPFFSLARFQFDEVSSVALQQVHAALQAQAFAEEGRLEHGAVFVDVAIARDE